MISPFTETQVRAVSHPECDKLVPNVNERRKASDPPLISLAGGYAAGNGCFDGGKEFAGDLAHDAWILGRNLLPGYAPYRIIKSAIQYGSDPAYRAEADAKALIVADVAKNPVAYATKMMTGIADFAATHFAQFPCLNTEAQMRIACKVGLNVATVVSGPGVTRLAMRGALALADSEKLAKLVSSVMGVMTKPGEATMPSFAEKTWQDGANRQSLAIVKPAQEVSAKPIVEAPGTGLSTEQKQLVNAALDKNRADLAARKEARWAAYNAKAAERVATVLERAQGPKRPFVTTKMGPSYEGETVGKSSKGAAWRVKYLNSVEREKCRISFKDGKAYGSDGKPINNANAIFVMAPDGSFYTSSKVVGEFHHSSFLASGEVAGAGHMKIEDGVISTINRSSGHYKPSDEMEMQVLEQLTREGVDIRSIQTVAW